jgi:hypothetical protein
VQNKGIFNVRGESGAAAEKEKPPFSTHNSREYNEIISLLAGESIPLCKKIKNFLLSKNDRYVSTALTTPSHKSPAGVTPSPRKNNANRLDKKNLQ